MNIGTLTVTLMADMTQLDKMTSGLNNISQRFRTFGYLASTALTLPMVMAGKASFQMAKDFEFSMQKIVGLTGVAQGAVNKWSDEILKLGPQLGKTPQELADALYFISSSGIKGAEAMNVLALSAKAAESGLGETKDVANVLTSALNAYRGTGLTAAYATDVLIAAIREGKAEAPGFVSAIGQLIPIAANLGVSFDQVSGGMAAITLTGSSAANAAVYLKGVFNTLLTANKQGTKSLESVGLSYAYLRKVLADGPNGLINVMQIFRDVQMTLGDEAIKDVLPNIRALTGFMSIAGKNFEYNTAVMKRVTEATGSLGVAWAAVSNTIKVRFDQAISQANVSLISMGKSIASVFLPILEKWVQKLNDLTKWFSALSEEQKRHKLIILAWIVAAGPLSLILSLIGYTISGLITVFVGFGKSVIYISRLILAMTGNIEALNAATATNATLTKVLLGPIGAVLLVIGALAAAYLLLKARIEAATDAGERFKKLQEVGKHIQGTEKGFQDKMGLIPNMSGSQLDTFRNEANQRLEILKDARLQLTGLRKKWQEEDQTYIGLQNKLAFSQNALTKWQGKSTGWNQALTVASFTTSVKQDKEAIEKYILAYNIGLDKSTTTLDTKIKEVEGTIKTINDTIKALPVDPILAQIEQQIKVAEALKVRNEKIAEIMKGVQDESKYTDSLATVMKTLGIEYDNVGTKADIFLKAIQDLTKEGLPANSKEIQDLIKQYQALGIEAEKSSQAINKWYLERYGKSITEGYGIESLNLKTDKKPTDFGSTDYQKFFMRTANYTAGQGDTSGKYQKHTVEELTNGLVRQAEVVNMLSNSFSELFSDLNIGFKDANSGFERMINSMLQSMERLLMELLAKAALWAILNMITGGAAGGFKVFMGLTKAPTIPGLANGGTVPPGFPNDGYLARLTSGETVLPSSMNGVAAQRNGMSGEVVFTIAGTTLVGVLKNQNRKVNSYS